MYQTSIYSFTSRNAERPSLIYEVEYTHQTETLSLSAASLQDKMYRENNNTKCIRKKQMKNITEQIKKPSEEKHNITDLNGEDIRRLSYKSGDRSPSLHIELTVHKCSDLLLTMLPRVHRLMTQFCVGLLVFFCSSHSVLAWLHHVLTCSLPV